MKELWRGSGNLALFRKNYHTLVLWTAAHTARHKSNYAHRLLFGCLLPQRKVVQVRIILAGALVMRIKTMALAVMGTLVVMSTLAVSDASAQVYDLSGPYQCIRNCAGPGTAFVTQNGWELNLVNEVGQPSRAWVDWPGHIWAQYWNEGALYSPDGMTIQFDNGSIWQRIVPQGVVSNRY